VCAGEAGRTSVVDAAIEQSGTALIITGFDSAGSSKWAGTISGETITFGGTRAEDGGLTTLDFALAVRGGGTTVAGTAAWNWVGAEGSCPGSSSSVSGFKVG
jgi:hypothetical protein